jgi:hypothetical protein
MKAYAGVEPPIEFTIPQHFIKSSKHSPLFLSRNIATQKMAFRKNGYRDFEFGGTVFLINDASTLLDLVTQHRVGEYDPKDHTIWLDSAQQWCVEESCTTESSEAPDDTVSCTTGKIEELNAQKFSGRELSSIKKNLNKPRPRQRLEEQAVKEPLGSRACSSKRKRKSSWVVKTATRQKIGNQAQGKAQTCLSAEIRVEDGTARFRLRRSSRSLGSSIKSSARPPSTSSSTSQPSPPASSKRCVKGWTYDAVKTRVKTTRRDNDGKETARSERQKVLLYSLYLGHFLYLKVLFSL